LEFATRPEIETVAPIPDWQRRPPQQQPELLHPRRVRGGLRPVSGILQPLKEGGHVTPDDPEATTSRWVAHRLLRMIEQVAPGATVREGLDYLTQGQVRRVNFDPGVVSASIQGRQFKAYVTTLKIAAYNEEQWGPVITAMSDQAVHGAKLLAGELPPGVEEVFAAHNLQLAPASPQEITTDCNCARPKPWCVHSICLAFMLADRLADEPMAIFGLRGMQVDDLLDRLRQRRMVSASITGASPVYVQRAPEIVPPPLDQSLANFYDSGPGLAELSTPLEPPAVTHPLLRRLGASPFPDSKFPLVGLLATCYDVISERTLRPPETPAIESSDNSEGQES
jgi:uncharacterized Zn finger protein